MKAPLVARRLRRRRRDGDGVRVRRGPALHDRRRAGVEHQPAGGDAAGPSGGAPQRRRAVRRLPGRARDLQHHQRVRARHRPQPDHDDTRVGARPARARRGADPDRADDARLDAQQHPDRVAARARGARGRHRAAARGLRQAQPAGGHRPRRGGMSRDQRVAAARRRGAGHRRTDAGADRRRPPHHQPVQRQARQPDRGGAAPARRRRRLRARRGFDRPAALRADPGRAGLPRRSTASSSPRRAGVATVRGRHDCSRRPSRTTGRAARSRARKRSRAARTSWRSSSCRRPRSSTRSARAGPS